MATTTNYGWVTPDDTALVKDGASAIRTLGTSIDTTTYNNSLLPIVKTIVDAKGDIIAATAADAVSRLAVGANDTVLTADSAQATGLKWATPAAGGMTLLSTTTLSGVTTTISSISQSYNSLMVVITGMTGNTSDRQFRLLPNGSATESTYLLGATQYTDNRILLASLVTLRTSAANAWTIIFNNYTSTTTAKPFNFYGYYTDATAKQTALGGGAYTANTALSSLTFDYQGTNTFAGGTVLVYGVK